MTRQAPKLIFFQPGERAALIGSEETVLAVALKNGIEIAHSCGGMGSCTTCRVFVLTEGGKPQPRTDLEQEAAESRGFAENERLSCQLAPVEGLIVRIPLPLESDLG